MERDIELIKTFAQSIAFPSEIHGFGHWKRVERNGIQLSKVTGANVFVVRLFAYLHDSCRLNDHNDPDHGKRAAEMIQGLRNGLLSWLTEKEFNQLIFACEYHTDLSRSNDLTIDTCFDADRLDLNRVGIIPDPERMATVAGAQLATNSGISKMTQGSEFNLVFAKESFPIEKMNRQYVIRISSINPVNMFFCSSWDFSAKSVSDPSGKGIYGMLMQMYVLGYDWFFRLLISSNPDIEDIRILILEVDKGDIILENVNEVAFLRANVHKVFTASQFISFAQTFPLLNSENVSETIKTCSKAGVYFGQNDFESWLKYTVLSFDHMMSIRSARIPESQEERNYRKMFEPTYKALKKLHEIREGISESIIK